MNVPLVSNAVQLAGFSVAMVEALAIPVRTGGRVTRGVKLMLASLMGIYVFVALSHLLQYAGITLALDVYENYLKVLFFPLAACTLYAVRVNDQLLETQRHGLVLSAEHDMLMRIVDTTPNALVVLDATGRVEFSNDKARQFLELEENPETGAIRTPGWVCDCDPSAAPGVMTCAFDHGPLRDMPCLISWPDGRRRYLLLNATPIISGNGTTVGGVVAFVEADAPETQADAG